MKCFFSAVPVVVLGWLLGTTQPAQAQNPAMSLMGSVQSDSQAPLPGAAVTVIHLPSGVRHSAATDAYGHFMVTNLMVGGPYLIRVGEGGYRPQTVENVFLETGKSADFAVTLNKLGDESAKANSTRSTPATTPTLALANQAVAGGPVQGTTLSGSGRSARAAATTRPAATHPVSTLAPAVAAAPLPATPVALATPPPTAATAAPNAPAPASAAPIADSRYPRDSPDPARRPITRAAEPVVPVHFNAKTGNYFYETGQPTTLKLPGGGAIAGVGANSTESYLFRFLNNPQVQVDTMDLAQGWYNFDQIFFEADKATLTPASISQLRHLATLLRAYPKARLKLGGHTDGTGTYKVNRALSEARAHTAWASMVEMGISPNRIEARGYGPNHSIGSNTTEEGRAQNRRLSVKVLQK